MDDVLQQLFLQGSVYLYPHQVDGQCDAMTGERVDDGMFILLCALMGACERWNGHFHGDVETA